MKTRRKTVPPNNPLKILIVHNHYQQRGGEDSVFETECAMLRDAGHTVICYTKHNDEINNEGLGAPSSELRATADKRGQELGASVNGNQQKDPPVDSAQSKQSLNFEPGTLNFITSLKNKLSLFFKTIWNRTTYREVMSIIKRERPDIVHCHNTFPLISPSVYWAARKQNVPVVQTLHNYRFICINPYFYRNNKICEDCLGRSPIRGIIHRCYRGSFAASFTVAAMLMTHRLLGTYRNKVTTYIALTEFAKQKFVTAGLPASKIVVKPNAVAQSFADEKDAQVLGVRCQGLGDCTQPSRKVDPPSSLNLELGTLNSPSEGGPGRATLSRLAADSSLASTTSTQSTPSTSQTQNPSTGSIGFQPVQHSAKPQSPLTPNTYHLTPKHSSGPAATVLYVGRLSPEKGVDILIRGWKIFIDRWVADQGTNLAAEKHENRNDSSTAQLRPRAYGLKPKTLSRLHIIGDGPQRPELEALTANIPSITFLGRIPHSAVTSHMQSATALVLPSRCYEQFAITPLEAMQNGLLVIASKSASHGTIIEDGKTGLVFETGNPKSLGQTLSVILNDPATLQAISANGKEACLSGPCQIDNNLIKLIAIYRATTFNLPEVNKPKDTK